MSKVIFDVSMSLDGFVKATGCTPQEPLGKGGERLYEWAVGGDPGRRRAAGGRFHRRAAHLRELVAPVGVRRAAAAP